MDTDTPITNKVFIAPVSPNVTSEHIREIMANFGDVVDVLLFPMKTDHGDIIIASITLDSQEAVESSIKHLDKGNIDGIRIRVTATEPQPQDLPKVTLQNLLNVI